MKAVRRSIAAFILPFALVIGACNKNDTPMMASDMGVSIPDLYPPTIDLSKLKVDVTDPGDLVADGISSAQFSFTVVDLGGHPVQNTIITLKVSGQDNLISQPGVTNDKGVAHGAIATRHAESKEITILLNNGAGDVEAPMRPMVAFAAGPAAKLAFTTPPSLVAMGVVMMPVVVTLQDSFGNTATDANSSVSLAIASNPTGALLGGTVTVTADHGVAQFADLTVDRAAMGYALSAATSGFPIVQSVAFEVTPAKLGFVAAPASTTAGATLAAIDVQVQDASGNLLTGASPTISLALANGTGDAMLIGTTTVKAMGGVASFSMLSVQRAGQGYALTAGAPHYMGATSGVFSIAAGAPDPAQSLLTATPSSLVANDTALCTLTATVRDAFRNPIAGNVVTFTATGTQNNFSSPTATTNGAGVATVTLKSPTAESKTVSGTMTGGATLPMQTVTFTAPTDM